MTTLTPRVRCADPGFDCEDAPIARASSYLVRLNMGLVWFPVCRNIWAVCRRTGGRGLLSYEQQVALHRWLGYSVVAAVTVHLAGFWIQWLGQGMDVFVDNALPSGTATSTRPPVCEQGLCYGICGGGKQDGMGPCGVASSKDCCHISPRKKDGISQAQLPSTGENACICPLEICAGCGALVEPTAAAGDSPTALPTGDLTAPPQEEEQVQHYDVGLYNFYGEVSWLAMLVMFLFGIQSCRRKHWDLFYYLHHLFVLAVIFGVLHDTNLLKVLAPGLRCDSDPYGSDASLLLSCSSSSANASRAAQRVRNRQDRPLPSDDEQSEASARRAHPAHRRGSNCQGQWR